MKLACLASLISVCANRQLAAMIEHLMSQALARAASHEKLRCRCRPDVVPRKDCTERALFMTDSAK